MISTTEPYVPATMRNMPTAMTNALQQAMGHHRREFSRPSQLSYSHIAPYVCRHMSGPNKAPMRETSPSNTGMALAMMYATTMTLRVQLNQTSQWVGLLLVRWREPRRRWTKMYFAGI